ncbi:hypothetical protein N9X71_01935 [Paracoccus sp. (in: a-proteobacteria)]|nr:hypothetical protein [Paracoccus sp. (in: a-proteobacteria)]
MKFSTRIDTDSAASDLFDTVGNFDRIERMLTRRGAVITRIDPAQEPGTGVGWMIGFDWRGQPRQLRLEVTRYDRPERMSMVGQSDTFDVAIDATVVALGRARSRLIFETGLRPRSMRARLMVQTAKLGKGQLDQRYARRINDFLTDLQA